MKFIKQIITDAKKQKDTITQKNVTKTKRVSPNDIPTIEIIECQQRLFDEKIFEYEMIHRAREAEALLEIMMANYENNSKLHTTMENLMSKFKSKNTKQQYNIPKIEVFECGCGASEEDVMMEMFIQRANEAQTMLERLLNNCEYITENSNDSMLPERDRTDTVNREKYHRGSPSKRVAFKGQGFTLDNMKKRKIVLDLPTTNSNFKKLTQKNFYGTIGLEGKFTAMEV